jgi:hypothetical protein
MNGKLPSMFACFLPYRDSHRENVGKKNGRKILPKHSKRMRLVRILGIWAVRELPFHLRYRSFGSLMPALAYWTHFYMTRFSGEKISLSLEARPLEQQSRGQYYNTFFFITYK